MNIKSISLKSPNGITLEEGDEILLERVGRIIMTKPFERLNNPIFGSLTEDFLFELPDVVKQNLEIHLRQVIEKYEPRVLFDSFTININKDIADVKISLIKKENYLPLSFEISIGI